MPTIYDTLKFYARGIIELLIEPRFFFTTLPEKNTLAKALGFLGLSSLFFAGASLLTGASSGNPVVMGLIYFANASGMVCIGSVIGYAAMVMMFGKKASFCLVFSLYVYASGITLLVSWLPFLLWLTELWKYWLIFSGFRRGCGLSKRQALEVLVVSLPIQWCLIYSAMRMLI
ncbi:MAG: hypothetical protein HUN05_21830 [Desulfobacter sp.]|nr:MAG: hypothetical protein HUN05_21830 [Desulfobacter sp.]